MRKKKKRREGGRSRRSVLRMMNGERIKTRGLSTRGANSVKSTTEKREIERETRREKFFS